VFLQHHNPIRNSQRIMSRLVPLEIPVQVGPAQGNHEFSGRMPLPKLQRRTGATVCMKGNQQVTTLICPAGLHRHTVPQSFQHPTPANRCHTVTAPAPGMRRNHDLNPPPSHIPT
tara:strand:+ start:191 stop:535 length:345 start_codon:yes stop_codon:yes gene_type:complete